MSRSQTEQKHRAVTAHGDVEYSTVTCSSCENEVPKESAKRLLIGDVIGHRTWNTLGKEDFELSTDGLRKGWCCEYCRESGPAGLPRPQLNMDMMDLAFLLAMVGMLLAFVAPFAFRVGEIIVQLLPL